MVLLLAIHSVEAATASLPFNQVILLDLVKRKAFPDSMRCRFVLPTSGTHSVSVWDVAGATVSEARDCLAAWLVANLGADCANEVSEVQEDFALGVGVALARARAAEKMAEGSKEFAKSIGSVSKEALQKASSQISNFDERTGVLSAAKVTTLAVGSRLQSAMGKVCDDPAVASLFGGFKSLFGGGGGNVNGAAPPRAYDAGYDAMLHESGTLLPPDEPPRGWQQQQQQPAVPAAGGWPAAAAAAPQEAAAVLGGAAEDGTPISPPVSTGGTERYFN